MDRSSPEVIVTFARFACQSPNERVGPDGEINLGKASIKLRNWMILRG